MFVVGSADDGASNVLVLQQQSSRWVNELIREVSNSSPGRQIAIGGLSGLWVFHRYIVSSYMLFTFHLLTAMWRVFCFSSFGIKSSRILGRYLKFERIIIGLDRRPETKQGIEGKIDRFRSGRVRDRVRVRYNWSPIWTRSPIWSYQFWRLLNSDRWSEPDTVQFDME